MNCGRICSTINWVSSPFCALEAEGMGRACKETGSMLLMVRLSHSAFKVISQFSAIPCSLTLQACKRKSSCPRRNMPNQFLEVVNAFFYRNQTVRSSSGALNCLGSSPVAFFPLDDWFGRNARALSHRARRCLGGLTNRSVPNIFSLVPNDRRSVWII